MKKYIKLVIVTLLLVIHIAGCKKDFLEVEPTTAISENSLFESPDMINAYIIAQYDGNLGWGWAFGRGDYNWGNDMNLAAVSDEAIDQWDYDSQIDDYNYALITPGYTGIFEGFYGQDKDKVWLNSYKYIRNANSILENLKDNTVVEATKLASYIAEIKFLRAFRYFNILKFYGGAVLMDKAFTLGDDYNVPRNTIEETVAFIIKDIDDAEKDLPTISQDLLGRATKQAAMALRSRVLLYAASPLYNKSNDVEKWKVAADASLKLIEDGSFSFAADYAAQFVSAVGNTEAIFSTLNVAPPVDNAHQFYIENSWCPNGSGIYGSGYGCMSPIQNLVDDFEMDNGKLITDPTSGYDPQNPYKNRDPRFYYTIVHNGSPLHGDTAWFYEGGNLSFSASSYASPTRYAIRKFLNPKTSPMGAYNSSGTQPYIHFRLSEIYLNYAEAINEYEGPDKAYLYINSVRTRSAVGLPPLPAGLTQAEMRDRIRHERRIELVFEDHRFFDVKRWKIAEITDNIDMKGIVITKDPVTGIFSYDYSLVCRTKVFDEKMYFLPIPLKEIQSNSLLEQNPGY